MMRPKAGMESDALRRLRVAWREGPLGALVLVQPLFFFRPLFVETFFFRDMYQLAFPGRRFWATLVRGGELPFWDPYAQGGQPFLANVINTALYPTNLLYLVLPPVPAFNLEIVLHFAACGIAAYLLARALGMPAPAALLAGVVFEFCGYTLSLGSLFTRLIALPWLPLVLLFWMLWLSTRRRTAFVATVVALAVQIVAGSPELTVQTVLLGALLTVASAGWRARPLLEGSLAAVAAVALAMPQLLPGLALLGESSRGAGNPFQTFAAWSVDPRRLPELVLPGFLGRTDRLSEEAYWGRLIEDEGFPYVMSLYFGLPVILLAGLALRRAGSPERVPRRLCLVLSGVLVAALILSLGRHLPLAGLLYAVPPFRAFRFPVKFLMAALIPAALLPATALSREFVGDGHSPRRGTVGLLGGSGAAALLLAAVLLAAPAPSARGLRLFFGEAATDAARRGVARALVQAGLAAAAVALLAAARRVRPRTWHAAAVVLVVGADLMSAGAAVNPFGDRALLNGVPPVVERVRQVAGEGSLFRMPDPVPLRLRAPTDDIFWLAAFSFETLGKGTAARFGIPEVFFVDVDGSLLREARAEREELLRLGWEERVRLLSAAGVRAVLAFEGPPLPGLEFVAEVPNASRHRLFLYRNSKAVPPARFVTVAARADSLAGTLRRLGAPGADPDRQVFLPVDAPRPAGEPCPAASVTRAPPSAGSRLLDVRSPCPGYLVLTTPRYRGWTARVDGEAAPLLPADGLFLALRLAAGEHRIELAYTPPGFRTGLAAAAATAAALALFLIGGRRRPSPAP